jgi:putative transposase
LLVDTMGLVLMVVVSAASVQDRDGGKRLLELARCYYSRIVVVWADAAYGGEWLGWVWKICQWFVQIVRRDETGGSGFHVQPKRWIVERTFAWLCKYRRLVKDYEYLPSSSEAFIYLAMSHLMLRRLSRD